MAGLRVLVAASEVAGFAKTGGLADVTAALPRALAKRGNLAAVVMPLYSAVRRSKISLDRTRFVLPVPMGSPLNYYGVGCLDTNMVNGQTQASCTTAGNSNGPSGVSDARCKNVPGRRMLCPVDAVGTRPYVVEPGAGATGRGRGVPSANDPELVVEHIQRVALARRKNLS